MSVSINSVRLALRARKEKLRVCWFVRKKRAGYARKNEEYAVTSGIEELVVPKRIKSMLVCQEEKSRLRQEE